MKDEPTIYQCPQCGTICSKDYLVKEDSCPNCQSKIEVSKN